MPRMKNWQMVRATFGPSVDFIIGCRYACAPAWQCEAEYPMRPKSDRCFAKPYKAIIGAIFLLDGGLPFSMREKQNSRASRDHGILANFNGVAKKNDD